MASAIADYFSNIWTGVTTICKGMMITAKYGCQLKTVTTVQYPYEPISIFPRYRGYHRFDITTCIACEQCAKACPVDCIYVESVGKGKKAKLTGFTIDYTKCMFCALCVDPCPVYPDKEDSPEEHCINMGTQHDLSCYSRDGCMVDFTRLPQEIAWSTGTKTRITAAAVEKSKEVTKAIWGQPPAPKFVKLGESPASEDEGGNGEAEKAKADDTDAAKEANDAKEETAESASKGEG